MHVPSVNYALFISSIKKNIFGNIKCYYTTSQMTRNHFYFSIYSPPIAPFWYIQYNGQIFLNILVPYEICDIMEVKFHVLCKDTELKTSFLGQTSH